MTMTSESARVTSALESRFRIDKPNSRPRSVAVIAIDRASGAWVTALQRGGLQHARFFSGADLVDDPARLAEAIGSADVAVMLATAGADQRGVEMIGAECSRRRVSTTALVHCPHDLPEAGLMSTLRTIRPWMVMLVMFTTTDYVEDVLRSMGA